MISRSAIVGFCDGYASFAYRRLHVASGNRGKPPLNATVRVIRSAHAVFGRAFVLAV